MPAVVLWQQKSKQDERNERRKEVAMPRIDVSGKEDE